MNECFPELLDAFFRECIGKLEQSFQTNTLYCMCFTSGLRILGGISFEKSRAIFDREANSADPKNLI